MKNSNLSKKIDFIGIGFPKSATSYIADLIMQHPMLHIPKQKEMWYFFEKDKLHIFSEIPKNKNYSMEWYLNHFNYSDKNLLNGEFTPTYIYDIGALKKIKKYFPNIKVLISIRNPVEMIYSQFNYFLGSVVDNTDEDFSLIFQDEKYNSLIEMGNIGTHLKNVYEIFDAKNVIVLFHEDIKRNPLKEIQKFYSFLNVDSIFEPIVDFQYNESRIYRYKKIKILANSLYKGINNSNLTFLKGIFFNNLTHKIYHAINTKKYKFKPLDEKSKQKLIEIYLNEINEVEKIFNIDLKHWKK